MGKAFDRFRLRRLNLYLVAHVAAVMMFTCASFLISFSAWSIPHQVVTASFMLLKCTFFMLTYKIKSFSKVFLDRATELDLPAKSYFKLQRAQFFFPEKGKLKYCGLCHFFKPPDTSHCSNCQVCIAGFDHHCFWFDTCIGRYNYA